MRQPVKAFSTTLLALVVTALGAGCSSSDSAAEPPATASPTATTQPHEPSAMDRWNAAYAFLAKQTKPTEIVCSWFRSAGGTLQPAERPTRFYDFADEAAWKSHIVTRNDAAPKGVFETCQANVPTSVPYGPAIDTFLARYGLVFYAGPNGGSARTGIEICYAGQNPDDPDIVYHDKPGLFGLELALRQLGDRPFKPGTSKIIQPADDATATTYLRWAKPLLDWYGYQA